MESYSPKDLIHLQIFSHPDYIKKARNVIEKIGKKFNLHTDEIMGLELAVNEALANIIHHAYENEPDGKIDIYFQSTSQKIEIIIKDTGKKPRQADFTHRNLKHLHDRGLGLLFIKQYTDEYTFDFSEEGENTLKLIKYLNRSTDPFTVTN
jgi:serine/threonine-protein kinase RsbW